MTAICDARLSYGRGGVDRYRVFWPIGGADSISQTAVLIYETRPQRTIRIKILTFCHAEESVQSETFIPLSADTYLCH